MCNSNNSFQYALETKKPQEFINITGLVQRTIDQSKVKNGVVTIFSPHTTAGITINENTDSNVIDDIIKSLNKAFPVKDNYSHMDGNSHAHLKASYMGSSSSVIIEDGNLKLGNLQGLYFCEFDGPRNRKIYIKIIEG